MTDVRTFKAATMQEALDLVRNEMGTDAVILHTRQVPRRRLFPWRKAKEDVEITAGLGVNVRSPASRQKNASHTNAAPHSGSRQGNGAGFRQGSSQNSSSADQRGRGPATLSRSDWNAAQNRQTNFPSHQTAASPQRPLSDPKAQAEAIASQLKQITSQQPAEDSSSPPSTQEFSQNVPGADDVAQKLDSIQKMIENLDRGSRFRGSEEVPSELFNLYTELIDGEVEDEVARALIFRLKQNCKPDQLSDGDGARALLTTMVESEIDCAAPITPQRGERKVVALVGPTGVGKTTTIAKLAANFRLRDGIKMGLVTVDTYRIAAVEQLRTYAEIIDLPMKVVTSPREMRRALDELVGLDLVLIDTAGRSPRDELKIQELKSLLAEADVDEVQLVLSLTASLKSLQATAEKFSAANTTSMILTKLDEAAGMGTLLSVSRKVNLPISYLTTGQDVPDDIEPANATRMARLILGRESLFNK